MNLKQFINLSESVVDIPRKHYAKGIFIDHDTDTPTLKPIVSAVIKQGIKKINQVSNVRKYSLIGSILTKHYTDQADIDVNVLISGRQEQLDRATQLIKKINGELVPRTEHPVNFYVFIDSAKYEKAIENAEAAYDIEGKQWIKRGKSKPLDIEVYEQQFNRKVKKLDDLKGELKRHIVDYKELKSMSSDDVSNLQALIKQKLDKIEETIELYISKGDYVTRQRKNIFKRELTPEEIREFGTHNHLPQNVLYKLLERYYYLDFYKQLKKVMEDGKVSDSEIRELTP